MRQRSDTTKFQTSSTTAPEGRAKERLTPKRFENNRTSNPLTQIELINFET